jgi:transposase
VVSPRPRLTEDPLYDIRPRRHSGQAERDRGERPGLTTDERAELKRLQREVFELKRANEILRKAAAFFAQAELDRRAK